MLTIKVGGKESFDESTQRFVVVGGTELQLEHSLVSVSKWEATYEKPFLGKEEKSGEEVMAYVQCMVVEPKSPGEILLKLDKQNYEDINAYIDAKMTATWFSEAGAPRTREVVTAELIYYWMTVFNIPWEAQHWHLNRLFALIRICNIKSAKPKKMPRAEQIQRQRELNAQRRAQLGSKG
jgi:hypothetical protein